MIYACNFPLPLNFCSFKSPSFWKIWSWPGCQIPDISFVVLPTLRTLAGCMKPMRYCMRLGITSDNPRAVGRVIQRADGLTGRAASASVSSTTCWVFIPFNIHNVLQAVIWLCVDGKALPDNGGGRARYGRAVLAWGVMWIFFFSVGVRTTSFLQDFSVWP